MAVTVSIADVQARMPQFPLSEASRPTLATATLILQDVCAEMSVTLANIGYVVPITGEYSVRVVQSLVIDWTIARIVQARSASVGGDAAFQTSERLLKDVDQRLKHLADPKHPFELTDAQRSGGEWLKPSIAPETLMTDEDGNELEPRATRDMVF